MILKTGDPLAKAYREAQIDVVELPFVSPRLALEPGKLVRYFLAFWPCVLRVARAIRSFAPDVVHVNTLYNLHGPMAARLAGRPLVWHIREMGDASRPARIILWLVARLATRAVGISTAVGATLEACGDRRRVILNGIDLADYEKLPDTSAIRAELGAGPGQPLVTTIGRLEPWKGQHVFLEAIPLVLEAHPSARFAIVGGKAVNKPAYADRLHERRRELGLEDCVILSGFRDDVPSVIAASDLVVLPTATAEPFGRTVVEAMAAGRPVVATAAGGPLDTVVDGETGWLAPPNDPAALAEKIIHILDKPEEGRAMGEKGKQRAQAHFSLERLVADMADLFEEVAASRDS
jgi:glycosyltransferase involved in cell wall biosynthesis